MTDRRPTIRPSRSRRLRPWWRRSARPWLLLGLLLAVIAAIVLLLGRYSPAQAEPAAPSAVVVCAFIAEADEQPDSP